MCPQRYYGKSMPFGSSSFRHPYIDLLTVEQALADYAVLVTTLKSQLNASDSRVIAFGGRYVCCVVYSLSVILLHTVTLTWDLSTV